MPISRSRLEIFKRSPVDNDNALGGWWPLDNDATDGSEISGNNNVASFVAAPPLVPGPAMACGISLNGTTQAVTTRTDFGTASTLVNISLSAWFKTSTASGVSFLMLNQLQDGSSGTCDRALYMGNDNKVRAYIFDTAPKVAVSLATNTDSLWHHAVATIASGSALKLYIDGVLQQSTVIGTVFTGYTSSFWVMGRNGAFGDGTTASTAGRYTGSIADAKVYNRVLTPSEVSAEYNRTLAGFAIEPDEWEMPIIQATAAVAGSGNPVFCIAGDNGRTSTQMLGY